MNNEKCQALGKQCCFCDTRCRRVARDADFATRDAEERFGVWGLVFVVCCLFHAKGAKEQRPQRELKHEDEMLAAFF
jgi:hypothetical protein